LSVSGHGSQILGESVGLLESAFTDNREPATDNNNGQRTTDKGPYRPDEMILATVQGRPVTKDDLVCSLGVAPHTVDAALRRLTRQDRIRRVSYSGRTFYEPA